MTTTIGALVGELKHQFETAGLSNPQLDARMLVCELLGFTLNDLVLDPGRGVDDRGLERVRDAAARRCDREPVHRILGRRSFFGLDLALSPETLEPRPDTETLVTAALPLARATVSETGSCRIVDLGTGSGAICLALLSEVDGATGLGTDISAAALATAEENAARNGLSGRFRTRCGNWFEAVEGTFDLIVSNPPYIPKADLQMLDPEVRDFDPHIALDGGPDGLDAYRAIAARTVQHLAPRGHIVVETGFDQHDAVCAVFEAQGFAPASRIKDFGGHDRVLVFRRGV